MASFAPFLAAFAAVLHLCACWGVPNFKVGVSAPEMGWQQGAGLEANGFVAATAVFADLWKVEAGMHHHVFIFSM